MSETTEQRHDLKALTKRELAELCAGLGMKKISQRPDFPVALSKRRGHL